MQKSKEEKQASRQILLEDLVGSQIVNAEGERLGRVVDIKVTPQAPHEVIGLVFGLSGWLYRLDVLRPFARTLGLASEPRMVEWDAVDTFEDLTVKLKPGREPERSL